MVTKEFKISYKLFHNSQMAIVVRNMQRHQLVFKKHHPDHYQRSKTIDIIQVHNNKMFQHQVTCQHVCPLHRISFINLQLIKLKIKRITMILNYQRETLYINDMTNHTKKHRLFNNILSSCFQINLSNHLTLLNSMNQISWLMGIRDKH